MLTELQESRAREEKALQDASVRERQHKKIMIKVDELQKQYADLNSLMSTVSREKQEAFLLANLSEQAKLMAQADLEKVLDQLNVQKTVHEQLLADKSQMREQI